MDILDILLDILLKPPQPLMGLFFRPQFKFWNGPFQMDIQILEYWPFWNFLEYTLLFKSSDFLIL